MAYIEAAYRVLIGGRDVTSRWSPQLISLSVQRAAGQASDSFDGVLADPDGATFLPETGASVEVQIGHSRESVGWVFSGFVNDVRHKGSMAGRQISVTASSADQNSKIKAPGLRTAHEKSFGDVAQEWGDKAGVNVTMIGNAGEALRPFWLQQHESFMGWGQRMARELGLTFKVIGDRAFFAPRNEGMSATGKPLTTIIAEWGGNLLSWDITPIVARPQFSKVHGRYYDIQKAAYVEQPRDVNGIDTEAHFRHMLTSAGEPHAEQSAGSASKESERDKGEGTVDIIGDHAAEPEAKCIVRGARPGIDGTYLIDSVSHTLSKGDGFTTSLKLKHPADGAGVDSRQAPAGSAASPAAGASSSGPAETASSTSGSPRSR